MVSPSSPNAGGVQAQGGPQEDCRRGGCRGLVHRDLGRSAVRGPQPFSHRISGSAGSADQRRAPPRDPTARRGGRHQSEGFLRSVVGWLLHRLPGPDVGACVPARPRRDAGRTQAAAAPASGASVSPVATGTAAAGGGKARAPQVSPRRHPHQPPTNPRPQPPTWPRPRPASRAAGAGPGRGPELVKTPAVSEGSSFPTPEGRQALYRSIITRSQMVFWELRSPPRPPPPPSSFRGRARH